MSFSESSSLLLVLWFVFAVLTTNAGNEADNWQGASHTRSKSSSLPSSRLYLARDPLIASQARAVEIRTGCVLDTMAPCQKKFLEHRKQYLEKD